MRLSNICDEIKPSAIRKMFNKALEYDSPISFTLGEPDFTASGNVVEAGCRAIREGKTKYSANAGILPLRQAIADYLKRQTGIYYNPEDSVVVTPGAMGALYLALKTILNKDDEVVISGPYWTNYMQQVLMNGGKPVFVEALEERDFDLDLDKLKAAVNGKTKAIIINSPSNPTGGILSHDTLQAIADIAIEHDLIVISDEVYKHIRYIDERYESIAELDGMQERTVIVDSFSKTYAMTGWRIGFAAGPAEIITNITKFQEDTAACASMLCQYAALEALEGSQEHLAYMIGQYKERRDYLCGEISRTPRLSCRVPKGTFYLFVNIRDTGMTSEEFAMALLEKKQVVVVPGTAFGEMGEGYIRISYATSMDNIKEGVKRIREFTEAL